MSPFNPGVKILSADKCIETTFELAVEAPLFVSLQEAVKVWHLYWRNKHSCIYFCWFNNLYILCIVSNSYYFNKWKLLFIFFRWWKSSNLRAKWNRQFCKRYNIGYKCHYNSSSSSNFWNIYVSGFINISYTKLNLVKWLNKTWD